MYYALKQNIYLVKGAKYSCLYDFNSSKLYHLGSYLSDEIAMVNAGKVVVGFETAQEKEFFDMLMCENLLCIADKPNSNAIEEVKIEETGIDFAWIEITTKCNLRCIHCYNESDAQCSEEMCIEDFKEVVDNLVGLNVSKIQLIGGEPFINKPLLKEMLDYVIGKFQSIEIFTNGTLITQEWLEYLSENNIKIALSVYSYNSGDHDKVTGQLNSWKKTNQVIESIHKLGITYRVSNTIMKDVNIGEKNNNLYALSRKKDIVRMSGRANFSLLSDELIRQRLITKETFQSPLRKALCQRIISGHNCFRNRIYVATNKEVFPCVMERRLSHCIIDSHSGIRLNDDILNFSKDKIEGCRDCEYRYACFDCRPNSLSGEIFEKPRYCTYEPKTGIWFDVDDFIIELKAKWGDGNTDI